VEIKMDMYGMANLAKEQAVDVKEMVQVLKNIDEKLGKILQEQEDQTNILGSMGMMFLNLLKDEEEDDECDDCWNETNNFLPLSKQEEDMLLQMLAESLVGCAISVKKGPTHEELVEASKEFIDNLISNKQLPFTYGGQTFYEYVPFGTTRLEFSINGNKTVSKLKNEKGEIIRTGSSRCSGNDVFDENIGKAISLFRLFEVEVPEIFFL
jgi:hypothetical protein